MYNWENTEEADAIFERISSEMVKQGRKQAELNTYLNLPRGTFTAWKLKRGRSFCEHLAAISEFLNVSVEWLVTGSEKKYLVTDEEKELVDYYRLADDEGKAAFMTIAHALAGTKKPPA